MISTNNSTTNHSASNNNTNNNNNTTATTTCFEAIAIRDHKSIHLSQLSFKKGDTIWVFETAPTGWSRGECNGKRGLFPHSYVVSANNNNNHSNSNNNNINLPPNSSTHDSVDSTTLSTERQNVLSIQHVSLPTAADLKKTPPTPPPRSSPPSLGSPELVTTGRSSPIPLLTVPATGGNTKLSPRFNVNKELLENSISTLRSGSPVFVQDSMQGDDDDETGFKKHGRKNSGPSSFISRGEETESSLNHSSGNIGINPALSPISEGDQNQSTLYSNTSNNNNNSNTDQQSKYKTLPHNHLKVRKPLSSITSQPQTTDEPTTPTLNLPSTQTNQPSQPSSSSSTQTRPSIQKPRITVDQINTEIPYYISRCVVPHKKQSYDEIPLNMGDLVIVYNQSNIYGEWWIGKIGQTFGVFPKQCVEIIKDISPKNQPTTATNNLSNATKTPPSSFTPPKPFANNNISITPNNLTPPNSSSPTIQSKHQHNNQHEQNPNTSPDADDAEQQRLLARKKIEESLSHLQTKEEVMEALTSMALKFVALKKELEQERTLREAFEKQLYQLTSKHPK
ncbi:hypothetical protein DFA_04267 [Cavenderia fasciculata]|uniref:SH3 domain-containing protein n=1 Tax=Cavenderia fasciculata TaxID=261658 RepID=F4PP36_CACFS|nr:uncharacterized protein DFA_04267 [Cavenderia fasciculata]EGG22149.1 hypothetical protein DFA_04267 [Cavenderia fasciculata]|eukprot:XP_004360000.1 hypothetical protein DFA_04267 [Cavenderia fasciculata]